ncbi:tetratricopeptide repeat protein [Streptomyces sp. NPDC005329]|uniref:tetratricopeptide repeat protein n=1 Tax=Streptomyces sp. NPDC005329 TaxID=3157034 RepID=UPI0033AA440A
MPTDPTRPVRKFPPQRRSPTETRTRQPLERPLDRVRGRPDHLLVAADRAAWAAIPDGCGRPCNAETQLRAALAVLQRVHGTEHYGTAVITHHLAALEHRRGNHTAAIDGYTRVLTLKARLLGDSHPDLATTLVNLGPPRPRQPRAHPPTWDEEGRRAAAAWRRGLGQDPPDRRMPIA